MTLPVHLFDAWETVAHQLARPERVALFTDFDGTLTPIRSRPGDVRMPARTRRLLAAGVKRKVLTGVISGRRLVDLRRRVGVRGAWYAGVHGYCLLSPGNRRYLRLTDSEREGMTVVADQLSRDLASETGIRVEYKVAAVAVHYRGAPMISRRRSGRVICALLAKSRNLRLVSGRKVWEILPAGKVDKASTIRFILEQRRTRPALVFLGDDLADEAVFRRMRGIMILVGRRRRTAARYWLRSPGEVRQFLERCHRQWK